jgi:hypothetical protein
MKTRQRVYWWFRFIFTGRFLQKFLNLRYNAYVAKALESGAMRMTGRGS